MQNSASKKKSIKSATNSFWKTSFGLATAKTALASLPKLVSNLLLQRKLFVARGFRNIQR